jgi:hypothetical protein
MTVIGKKNALRQGMGGVAIRLEGQGSQGRIFGVEVPGRIERNNGLDVISLQLEANTPQGKNTETGGITQGDGKISVVIGQRGESPGHTPEESRLVTRVGAFDSQDRDRTGEEILLLLAGEVERLRATGEPLPGITQVGGGTGGMESHGEVLAEAAAGAVITEHPDGETIARGIEIEEPASEGGHKRIDDLRLLIADQEEQNLLPPGTPRYTKEIKTQMM